MPTVGSKGPAGICGQQPTLVPCRAHRVPCVVMECQAAVRATNDLRCGTAQWAVKGAAGVGVGAAVLMLFTKPQAESQQLVQT